MPYRFHGFSDNLNITAASTQDVTTSVPNHKHELDCQMGFNFNSAKLVQGFVLILFAILFKNFFSIVSQMVRFERYI